MVEEEKSEVRPLQLTVLHLLDHFCCHIKFSGYTSALFLHLQSLFKSSSPFHTFFSRSSDLIQEEDSFVSIGGMCALCGIPEMYKKDSGFEIPEQKLTKLQCNHKIHTNICIGSVALKVLEGGKPECGRCKKEIALWKVISTFDKELWEKVNKRKPNH